MVLDPNVLDPRSARPVTAGPEVVWDNPLRDPNLRVDIGVDPNEPLSRPTAGPGVVWDNPLRDPNLRVDIGADPNGIVNSDGSTPNVGGPAPLPQNLGTRYVEPLSGDDVLMILRMPGVGVT